MTERNILWHQIALNVRDAILDAGYENDDDLASIITDTVFETLDDEGVELD
jgi:hypothetical protein